MAKSLQLYLDGQRYDQWTSGEVTRDLKDFSGSFSFTFRDGEASSAALAFASAPIQKRLKAQMKAVIKIGNRTVLKGHVEEVDKDLGDGQATVTISGRDKTGDLIDCAALPDGQQAEMKKVKLEAAAKKIAAPFGLTVKAEVDTGAVFDRYAVDLGETAFSAIEKGTRSRGVLVLSDGIGGIVITRAGKTRAPADLVQPGNVLKSRGSESTARRFSKTTVRGQSERIAKERGNAALDATAEPLDVGSRTDGASGAATNNERKGTVATGSATDSDIERYRPAVYLARSKADKASAQSEADWRSRTAKGEGDELTHTVKGHTVDGSLWTVNQLVHVSDAFLDVERDQLISRTRYAEDQSGATTDITSCRPEAFDPQAKGGSGNQRSRKSTASSGALDSKAEAL